MNYTITIQGRGGHGSRPDRAYNPVDCFAAIFGLLQQCKITKVDGGTANNVIPDKLILDLECNKTAEELTKVLEPICKLYNCNFEVNPQQ